MNRRQLLASALGGAAAMLGLGTLVRAAGAKPPPRVKAKPAVLPEVKPLPKTGPAPAKQTATPTPAKPPVEPTGKPAAPSPAPQKKGRRLKQIDPIRPNVRIDRQRVPSKRRKTPDGARPAPGQKTPSSK